MKKLIESKKGGEGGNLVQNNRSVEALANFNQDFNSRDFEKRFLSSKSPADILELQTIIKRLYYKWGEGQLYRPIESLVNEKLVNVHVELLVAAANAKGANLTLQSPLKDLIPYAKDSILGEVSPDLQATVIYFSKDMENLGYLWEGVHDILNADDLTVFRPSANELNGYLQATEVENKALAPVESKANTHGRVGLMHQMFVNEGGEIENKDLGWLILSFEEHYSTNESTNLMAHIGIIWPILGKFGAPPNAADKKRILSQITLGMIQLAKAHGFDELRELSKAHKDQLHEIYEASEEQESTETSRSAGIQKYISGIKEKLSWKPRKTGAKAAESGLKTRKKYDVEYSARYDQFWDRFRARNPIRPSEVVDILVNAMEDHCRLQDDIHLDKIRREIVSEMLAMHQIEKTLGQRLLSENKFD